MDEPREPKHSNLVLAPDPFIPQMVVTSADDTNNEPNNRTECTLVLVPPSLPTESTRAESMSSTPQKDLGDISDVALQCVDFVSHSVSQRPLVIEVDKNMPCSEDDTASPRCPTPPPPVPLNSSVSHPSAMQRPLIFESSANNSTPVLLDSTKELDKQNQSQDDPHIVGNNNLTSTSEISPKDMTSADKIIYPSVKESSHSIKKFFDTLWHSEQLETVHEPNEFADVKVSTISSDTTKDEKRSVQSSCHSYKSEPSEEKHEPHWSFEKGNDAKEHTSFTKDAKQSIKAFFDTFKHHAEKDNVETKIETLDNVDDETLVSLPLKEHKESWIKSFYDTSKHESSHQKHTNSICKKSASHPDFTKESEIKMEASEKSHEDAESVIKNAKQHKSLFDTFRHNSKQKNCTFQLSASQPDVCPESSKLATREKEHSSFSKENIKAFFSSLKHEPSSSKQKNEPLNEFSSEIRGLVASGEDELSSSFVKDTQQNVKTCIDSVKHEKDQKSKEIIKKKPDPKLNIKSSDTVSPHKNQSHPLKQLFSFKHIDDGKIVSLESAGNLNCEDEKSRPNKGTKSVKLDLTPTYSLNGMDNFNQINGYENELVIEHKGRSHSVPSEIFRKNKDSDIPPTDLKNIETNHVSKMETSSEQQKESFQGIKKFFGSFKHEKLETTKSVPDLKDCKTEKVEQNENFVHEPDYLIRATKEKKNKSIKRSLSDKISREEMMQNVKGFFDSIGHKSLGKKAVKVNEHIYDTVEVQSEQVLNSPISSESMNEIKNATKRESKTDFRLSKSISEISNNSNISQVATGEKSAKKGILHYSSDSGQNISKINEQSTSLESKEIITCEANSLHNTPSKQDKGSMFNSLGENILAVKDKIMHAKEKRKSNIDTDTKSTLPSVSCNVENLPTVSCDTTKLHDKIKPVVPDKPSQNKIPSKKKILPTMKIYSSKKNSNASSSSPASLYDTCCMKIAILLHDKALHLVSDRTKSPPPKPPKPSAEAIARARSTAASRYVTETQNIDGSIQLGYEHLRFADDDTESSCDYKDVENFNYILDYELIQRYKLENKLETLSASSGLSSYYTADVNSMKDEIYSDALLETNSLNSDASYNSKPFSNKYDFKISSVVGLQKETKKGICVTPASKDLKASTSKKVPPPIPPKPAILQSISKVKIKPGESIVSPCINSLSLSPRLQNKFSKDPTQKRPLLVADVKGTQFFSLPKSASTKPLRNLETTLKKESLKNISQMESVECISDSPPDKHTLQMQPLSTEAPISSCIKEGKRTVSPPRPPPPNIKKKPTPQRPPPPAKDSFQKFQKQSEKTKTIEQTEIKHRHIAKDTNNSIKNTFPNLLITEKSEILPDFDKNNVCKKNINDLISPKKEIELDLNSNQIEVNSCINNNRTVAGSSSNNIDRNQVFSENPKPPPRGRRIRSQTIQVVRKNIENKDDRLKRSQSLSDIDVEKRVSFLEAEKSRPDAKSLYSSVNKDGKQVNNHQNAHSSPDLVLGRPLPPPPPPPRKFRSLERTPKENAKEKCRYYSLSPVKPPVRHKKTEKEKYFSIHTKQKTERDLVGDNFPHISNMPTKPDRKIKSFQKEYDINANISNIYDSSTNPNIPFDSVDTTTQSKAKLKNNDKYKKSHSSWYDEDQRMEESWEIVDAASPDVENEIKFGPKVPLRRKAESKLKVRETSKFYVNVKPVQTSLPLVDKETSPLPLECSEKSVQTSLETLSQDIVSSHDVSHDDQAEDTDELLDLAQTLQKELSTIINRHKIVNDSSEDAPSPVLSEKNVVEDSKETKRKISSVRSSTSEVWPLTSSDESDVGEDSSNFNEMALKRKQKKIFYIAKEIMTSEEIFVDTLKLLNVDFKSAVQLAGSVIPEECLSQILNHLPQLLHLNENLLSELKDRINNWDKNCKIADIIVKMGPFLKLYSWYIHDFEANVALLEDCKKKYPTFAQIVKDFEATPRCKRLALHHYMLKPIQRIPQYRLLLQEYHHHLGGEDHPDYQDTVTALQIVSEVANHANESMKQGDNAQKLISLQNSILGHKEIVKPGRIFVKEGELMKLSRKGMQPRWFVLFNDLLLYLTNVQQGLYRMNHELPLTGMKVAIPIQQDYQNEFSIISVTRSFTLAARSPEERQEWIIALTKAIEENASKRSTFTNTRLMQQKAHERTSSEDENIAGGGFILGRKAPVWIPDARVTMCQLCTSEFTVTFRRHHCRACGKVVCSICSSHRISLPYLGNRIARVCDECHIHLGQGSSACTESGETDSENQQIALKSHLRTDNTRHLKKNKRPLPSVLKEVCANDQGSIISGYLHILRDKSRSSKRDWFVLKDKVLYQYRASEDVAALRSIPLLGYQIKLFSEAYEGVEAPLLFQLTHSGQPPVIFYTDSSSSTERWVSALETATVLE